MKIRLDDIPLYSKDAPLKEILMAKTARPLTWLLIHTPISANQVTMLSMFVALIGCCLMIPGNYWLSLLGLAFFCLFMLLDHCDGQVSRYKHQSSKAGLYLDSRVHHIVEPLFFICCGIGVGIMTKDNIWYFVAGIAASTFYLMRQLMKLPEETTPGNFRALNKERSLYGKANYFLFQFLRINYPFSLLFFAIIFDVIGPVLIIYALVFMANLIMSFYNTYAELKRKNEPLD